MLNHFVLCCVITIMLRLTHPTVAQETPTNLSAKDFVKRGLTLNANGQHEKAIAAFSAALQLSQTDPVAFLGRANSSLALGDARSAMKDCDAAIQLAPKFAPAYYNRGLIWSDAGNPRRALDDFNKSILLDPSYALSYHNRGNLLRQRGDFDDAIKDFGAAIKLEPKYALAYYNRGLVFNDTKQYDLALNDYKRSLEIDWNQPYVHNAIAWLAATCPDVTLRDTHLALTHAQTACELTESSNYSFLDTLAVAYAQNGQFDNAAKTIEVAIRLAPIRVREQLREDLEEYEAKTTKLPANTASTAAEQ